MAGTSGARRFTDADKAAGLTALAANSGNVKRTARDLNVNTATLRRWRDQAAHGAGPSEALVVAAVSDFVETATRVRDKSVALIEAAIDAGKYPVDKLPTLIGILDDKITRAKGLPTSRIEQTSPIPDRDTLREVMAAAVQGAIEAAEKRHDVIVEAEVVREIPAITR